MLDTGGWHSVQQMYLWFQRLDVNEPQPHAASGEGVEGPL